MWNHNAAVQRTLAAASERRDRVHHRGARQPSYTSRMVTVTDPSSVTAGAGAASQGWNRSGTSSPGAAVHNQQMNLALLSSGHGVRGNKGGSSAVLSAASVAAGGGPSPSNCVQSLWVIRPGPPPCQAPCPARGSRPVVPDS